MDQNQDPWERRNPNGTAGQSDLPDWASLSPIAIAAFGPANRPTERLMTLQQGVASFVHLAATIHLVGRAAIAAASATIGVSLTRATKGPQCLRPSPASWRVQERPR